MAVTKIEWTDYSWNPVTGCTPVSEGCQNCYAKRMAQRLRGRCGYPADEPFKVTLHPSRLKEPLKWKKPRKIFVCSMGDLFHEDVPVTFLVDLFDVIYKCPQHTFIFLTKRPEKMKWLRTNGPIIGKEPLRNVWLGVTVENQKRADERIPILLQIPAAVRFVSVEPMLGPVDLSKYLTCQFYAGEEMEWRKGTIVPEGYPKLRAARIRSRIDWVICGGETGPNARPLHPDWVRDLRNQCIAANVPFFFKSWGEWTAVHRKSEEVYLADLKDNQCVMKAQSGGHYLFTCVGKKKAGHLLDGQTWNEFPKA